MADDKKEEEKIGDQEAMNKLDWNGKTCRAIVLILVGLAIVLLGVVVIIRFFSFGSESSPFYYIWTFYQILFMAMLVVSIIRVHRVLVFFSFLSTKIGVGIFMIFIGTLLFDWNAIFQMCVAIVLGVIGGLYIFYGIKVGDQDQKEEEERKKELEKDSKNKTTKEDQKGNRKDKYEDKGNKDKDKDKKSEDAKATEEQKRPENQVSSPPSYQPKEGAPVYHNQPHIEKYVNPATAAMRGVQSNYAEIKRDIAPVQQYLPQVAKYAAAGIQQNFSPEMYAQKPNNYNEYDESEDRDDNMDGVNFQNMPQRINIQNNFGPGRNVPQYDSDEEDDDSNYYQSNAAAPHSLPGHLQEAFSGSPGMGGQSPQKYKPAYEPPPPDQQPYRLPQNVNDKLKKFKDINDLLG